MAAGAYAESEEAPAEALLSWLSTGMLMSTWRDTTWRSLAVDRHQVDVSALPAQGYAAVCLGRTHSAIRWPTAISARRSS